MHTLFYTRDTKPVDKNQKELEWLYLMVSHFALGYSWSRMEFFGTGKMHFHSFPVKLKPIPDVAENLLLGERDLHGFGRGDLEALQGVPCRRRLNLVLELDEGDVVPAGDEADLLEARELVEQHRQHHLVRLLGQVRQEQDLVGRRVLGSHGPSAAPGCSGATGGRLDRLLGRLLFRLL